MTINVKKKWPGSATNFVTAAAVILQNAKDNQKLLAEEDSTITPQSLKDVDTKIQNVKKNNLGKDKAKDQRSKTATVIAVQATSLKDLGSVKNIIQTKIKSKARQKELLTILGFNTYWVKANNKNQQALSSLLNHFATNLTADIRIELETAGVPKTRHDNLLLATTSFDNANEAQEGSKTTKLTLTADDKVAINSLYEDIIAICKAGQRVFQDNEAKKLQFTLSYIMDNLGGVEKVVKKKKDTPAK